MSFFPLFGNDGIPVEVQFIPAVLVGFAFGFTLERSGFGNARILAAQFYLYNMRVFKVMFSAIVTAALGMALLSTVGLLDLGALAVPTTFLWPHLVGGLMLGAGFIISGYCPGTSIVAFASGNWDGLATVVGVVVGSLVFGEVYPLIAEFHLSGDLGVYLLSDFLGIGLPLVVLGVALMAIGAFFGAEKLEAIMSRRAGKVKEASWNRTAMALMGGFAVVGAAAAAILVASPVVEPQSPALKVAEVSPVEAARLLIDQPRALFVVDLRQKPECSEGKDRLPYAICLEDIAAELADLPPERSLLAYGAGESKVDDLPAVLSDFPGELLLVSGGHDAWRSMILAKEPSREALASLSASDRALVPALHSYFTGTRVKAAAPVVRPKVKRKTSGGGGCG